MKNIFAFFFLSILISGAIFSQPFTNVQVSNTNSPNELSICINPKNLNQVVAGANINQGYYSTNGGLNWTRVVLTDNQNGVWGDPVIEVDTAGNFYYFHLANPPSGQGHWIDRIVCQKSTNAGVTWSNPGTYMGRKQADTAQDKQWVCIDRTHGSRGNWIYSTWTQFDDYGVSNTAYRSNIMFSRSTDAGMTWRASVRINQLDGDCYDEDNTVEGAVPTVGPNGELYVAWSGPKVVNSQYGIFFDKSSDGGNTWLANDIYVTDQPGGWDQTIPGINRANAMPITVCDVSNSPYRGHIYIVYGDQVNAADHDIRIVKSTNGGVNWTTPFRINDDPPGKQQFFPWMTIDQVTGYIYVVFYDRRNYTDNQTDVYLARSTNGGASFTNVKISESPFLPTSSVFFGDYIGITAHNGKVRPFWMRLHGGQLSAWTAIIEFPVAVTPNGNEIPSSYSLQQNYPNPFNPSTTIKFSVPYSGLVNIKIYDAVGREIQTIVNEQMNPGTYQIEWNAANYSSGVYYYSMTTGDGSYQETKKMVLTK